MKCGQVLVIILEVVGYLKLLARYAIHCTYILLPTLLYAAFVQVHSEMDGNIPNTTKELEQLPGVGPYTAGAVASIAFSERAPVVDGNVIRVMARLRAIGACTTTTVSW
jgi:adenine-specific DNA glycosylase